MLLPGFNVDSGKLAEWEDAGFVIQFLRFNGEAANGQNGSIPE